MISMIPLRSLVRDRRGVGAIIGAVFFLIILMTGYMYYTLHVNATYEYNKTLQDMQELDLRRSKESLEILSVSFDNGELNITVRNAGSYLARLIWLGIFDETVTPHKQDYYMIDFHVNAGETIANVGNDTIPSFEGEQRVIQIVTDLGNTFIQGYPEETDQDSVYDYVDAEGDPPTIGNHSSFWAQQAGPDGIVDTLTEAPVNASSSILFEQVEASSEQSTSNTAWTDVPGATLSFTPKSSTEEWLVFVSADIRSSSTAEDRARFRYDINGAPAGETGVQQGTTSTLPIDPYNIYFHFTRITGVTSQQTVKFQFQASSGATAYTRNVRILCIRLDSASLEYSEVNGDTPITGSQTLATLQFTPSSSGDYIVAYCTLVSELPTGGGAETWLDYDSGTSLHPDPWTTPNTRRVHTDRDQFEPHALFSKFGLDTSQHAFRVQAQLRAAGETSTARDVRIAAFRVDAFDLLESDEDTAVSSTTGANTVRSVVNTLDPGEQRDYLVLAGIHTISSGTSSRESGGIEIDDVFVNRKGDQRLSYATIARIASHHAFIKTSSTSFKVETTYGRGGTGFNTIYSKQSVIYVLRIPKATFQLDLEVKWNDVDYDETHEWLSIYGGTMGSEDIHVDVWNGSDWITVFTDLESGWNSVDVSPYLASSTFKIRFRDSIQAADSSQDSWDIDVTFLRVGS